MKIKYHITIRPHYKVLLLMLLLIPDVASAQFSFDILSVEAFIDDHKRIKSALFARSSVEHANQLLHETCATANIHYKDINVELDKYTRCFDLIDLIYTTGKTAFNVRNTYSDIKEKLEDFKTLNQSFVDKCLAKGNIVSSDSLVINTYLRMLTAITQDADDMIKSLYDLAFYITGAAECTTSDLMVILENINDDLNHIRYTLDASYHYLWKYITIRTTYWKNVLYRAKTINQMCMDALQRWIDARHQVIEGHVPTLESRH